jgi:hypothetical protein
MRKQLRLADKFTCSTLPPQRGGHVTSAQYESRGPIPQPWIQRKKWKGNLVVCVPYRKHGAVDARIAACRQDPSIHVCTELMESRSGCMKCKNSLPGSGVVEAFGCVVCGMRHD